MRLREHSAVFAVMAGLAVFMGGFLGGAAAQTPYTYPQGGYRGVAGPDGVMTRAPGDADDYAARPLPPRGTAPAPAPHADRQPYYPSSQPLPRGENAPYPVEPQYSRQVPATAPEPYPEPQVIGRAPGYVPPSNGSPSYGAMPPYDERQTPPDLNIARPEPASPGMAPGMQPLRPPSAVPGAPGDASQPGQPTNLASLPPEDQPEEGEPAELAPQFKRQVVSYQTKEPAGTIIIDTPSTFLYYVNGDGTAVRYGIGVGREGFTWAGNERITRMAEWPDWHPPAEMIERQPYLPRFMAGGPGNPLGARALYLGKTIYRVHGTNQPSTIGKFVSSGCIRMLNEDVEDLYTRVKVGTKVVVLSGGRGPSASNAPTTR